MKRNHQQWDIVRKTSTSTGSKTSQHVTPNMIDLTLCNLLHDYLVDDNRISLQPLTKHPNIQRDFINASYIDVRLKLYMYMYIYYYRDTVVLKNI